MLKNAMNKVVISGKVIDQAKTKKKSIYYLLTKDEFLIGCCNYNAKTREEYLVNKFITIEGKLGKINPSSSIIYVICERVEINDI